MTLDDRPMDLRASPEMTRRARHLTTCFLLEVGTDQFLVDVHEGGVRAIRRGPFVTPSWCFALRAPALEWAELWRARPRPGHNDIMAMRKRRVLQMEGDLQPLMANLRYFKELLASVRDRPDVPGVPRGEAVG